MKNYVVRSLGSLITGIAALSLISGVAQAAVGRTAASPSVSLSGEAGYSIPIFTPPGTHGLAPQLALVYNHRLKEGLAGVGWSVSGLPAISRCAGTWVQNGGPAEVKLLVSDRYCLDGNQLRFVSGTYGTAGSTYRLEQDTAARVSAAGTAGNGPASFTVHQANGLIYEYGGTTDSRIESLAPAFATTARTWALNRISDREGNSIVFTYQEDGAPNGEYRVTSIAYASNSGQALAAQYTVSFTYATQPATDVDSQYYAGGRRDDTQRLTQIEVTHNPTATRVRRYTITYAIAPFTARSRLDTVQECAGPGITPDCFPVTRFVYQDGSQGFGTAVSTGTTVNGPLAIDINGDGRTDVVYSTTATSGTGFWAYRLANTSGGYNTAVTTTFANTNFAAAIAIDYNADGRDDVLVPQNGTTWWVLQGTASGLQAPINTAAPYSTNHETIALDYDGDGLDDLVYRDTTTLQLLARLRVWGAAFAATPTVVLGSATLSAFGGQNAKTRVRGLDANGDGRRDVVVGVLVSCPPLPCSYNVAVLGGGLGTRLVGGGLDVNLSPRPIDINGDGYSDLVYGDTGSVVWSISSGSNYLTSVVGSSLTNLDFSRSLARDYDGDGYEDLLIPNTVNGEWYWLRSNGVGLGTPTDTGIVSNSPTLTFPIDANGDGLDDIGYVTSAGVYGHLPHNGVRADLLSQATDGFGNAVGFAYIPLTQTGYTRGTGAVFPQQDYQGPVYVVRTVTAPTGIGTNYTLTYSYTGAQLNLQGRGLTGFTTRSVLDNRSNATVTETYKHDFPYIGALAQRDFKQPGGTVVQSVVNTWASMTGGTGNESYKLPYVSQSTETQNGTESTYNGLPIRTVVTNSIVDAYGFPTDVTVTATEASGGNGVQPGASYTQRVVHSSFADNTTNWCLGKPQQTQFINSHTQSFGTQIIRTVSRTWDTTLYCRLTQEITEPASGSYKVTRDLLYDGFGNVNSETITGIGMTARTTGTNWGTTGQFPNTVTNPLNQTTTFGWDYAKGVKTSETDPNGIAGSWQYDVFARQTRETRPDLTYVQYTPSDCTSADSYCGTADSLVRVKVNASSKNTSNAEIRYDDTYLDAFGRVKLTVNQLPNSVVSNRKTLYDSRGRVAGQSMPYAAGGTVYLTTFGYDLLNRLKQVVRPVSDTDPTTQTTSIEYLGLTTRTVDFESKESKKIENAVGAVVRSSDHAGYYQNFDYLCPCQSPRGVVAYEPIDV